MRPFCFGCVPNIEEIVDCRKCGKWETIKQRHSDLARYTAQLEKKLLLAAQLIEYHVLEANRPKIRAMNHREVNTS